MAIATKTANVVHPITTFDIVCYNDARMEVNWFMDQVKGFVVLSCSRGKR